MKNRIKFGKNDEAVSPVIGVILMVAITVILAAVIAAFVFGMGPPAKAPQASIRGTVTDLPTGILTLENQGGDNIVVSTTKIIVEQSDPAAPGTPFRLIFATSGTPAQGPFVTGDKLVIDAATPGLTLNGVVGSLTPTYPTGGGTGITLAPGAEITVTLIDIPSSQQIGNIKIRA